MIDFTNEEIRDVLGALHYFFDDYGDAGWEQIVQKLEEAMPPDMKRSTYTHRRDEAAERPPWHA